MTASTKGLVRDRDGSGWWSDDGRLYFERGAPMSDGGTAWLIWVQIADRMVETEVSSWYLGPEGTSGTVARMVHFRADTRWETPRGEHYRWFAHLGDAGALEEARLSGEILREKAARDECRTPGVG